MNHFLFRVSFLLAVLTITLSVFASPAEAMVSCQPILTTTLNIGSQNDEVLNLQKFLVAQGFLTADNQTGYFGFNTRAGVQRFQARNNIVTAGTPATTGYGLVGARTRTAMNQVDCDYFPTIGKPIEENPTFTKDLIIENLPEMAEVTVDVKANGSDDTISVASGAPVAITWTANPRTSATMTCTGSGSGTGLRGIDAILWNGNKTYLGLFTAYPIANTTYTITCRDVIGGVSRAARDFVTVNILGTNPTTPAPTLELTANPTTIATGQSETLTWVTTSATSCVGSGATAFWNVNASPGWNRSWPVNSSVTFAPASTDTYTMVCTGPGGSVSKSVTVTVGDSAKFKIGDRVAITGSTAHTRMTANGTSRGTHVIGDRGFVVGGPENAGGFTWWNIDFATGVDGWVAEDFLALFGSSDSILNSFIVNPTSIRLGQSLTISWSALGESVCNTTNFSLATNQSGVSYKGSVNLTPTTVGSVSYSMTCIKDGMSNTKTAIVTVGSPPNSPPTPPGTDSSVVIGNDVAAGFMPEVYGSGPSGRGFPGFFVTSGPAFDGFPPINGQCLSGYAVRTGSTRSGLSAQVCRFSGVAQTPALPVIQIDASWYGGNNGLKYQNIDRNFYTMSYPGAFNWGEFTQAGNTSRTIGLMFRYAVAKGLVSDTPEGYATWSYWCENSVGATSIPGATPVDGAKSKICLDSIADAIDQDGRSLTWSGLTAAQIRLFRGVTQNSAKFKIGDRVAITGSNAHTRMTANGTSRGTHVIGDSGLVVGGPENAGGFTWWNIDFATGVDGWVAEDFLSALNTASDYSIVVKVNGQSGSWLAPVQPRENTLTWEVVPATVPADQLQCNASTFGNNREFMGPISKSGTLMVRPDGSETQYEVTCTGRYTGASATGFVKVVRPNQRLSLQLNNFSRPANINVFENSFSSIIVSPNTALTLYSKLVPNYPKNVGTNPATCVRSGGSAGDTNWRGTLSGNQYEENSIVVNPTSSTTYTMTCSTPGSFYGTTFGESATAMMLVNVQ